MAKNVIDCINRVSPEFKDSVDPNIAEALADNDQAAAVDLLTNKIDNLNTLKDKVKVTHRTAVDASAPAIEQSVPGGYTNRGDDESNELDEFRPKSLKAILKNLVQRTGSTIKAIKHKTISKSVTEADQEVVDHYNEKLLPSLATSIEKVFSIKEGSAFKFRYKDMMQYLVVREKGEYAKGNLKPVPSETKLDPSVKEAIASVSYEWLTTSGKRTMKQTDSGLRSLLGLGKDENIPSHAATQLREAGDDADSVADNLGRVILQRMSIEPGQDSDALAKGRMERSLGYMALAAMEDVGIIERQEIFHGEFNKTDSFGLEALKNDVPIDRENLYYVPVYSKEGELLNSKQGKPTLTLVKVREVNGGFPSWLEKGNSLLLAAPDAFSKLFGNEPNKRNYSWDKFAPAKELFLGAFRDKISRLQKRNLDKYNDVPYEESRGTMAIFRAMAGTFDAEEGSNALQRILGIQTMDGKLGLREESVESSNNDIRRDYESILTWEEQRQERDLRGESQQIYVQSEFQGNSRMGQKGDLNPQNSKMHRNAFTPASWVKSFKISADGNTDIDRAFMEAIAFAFDIESGKVGGPDNQRAAVDLLINDPNNELEGKQLTQHLEIRAALGALKEFHKSGEMSLDQMDTIATGVEATENKVHGLKGLVELARYEEHRDTSIDTEFTTDMYKEIDGVSNGPIIGMIQFMPEFGNKQNFLATVAMGGMSINPEEVNLDEDLTQLDDAYMRMARVWAQKIAELKVQLFDKTDQSEYNKAVAIREILGTFQDPDGTLERKLRGLSKPRTMQTSYGATAKTQIGMFAKDDIVYDGIYAKIEGIIEAIEDPTNIKTDQMLQDDLQKILDAVGFLTDSAPESATKYTEKGELSVEKLTNYELSTKEIASIVKSTNDTYGKAMKAAIDEVYGDLIRTKDSFQKSVKLSVNHYNAILKDRVDAVLVTKEDPKRITVAELDKILKDIDHLIPRIKTPLHSASDPSMFPLVKPIKKDYSQQSLVEQSYDTKGLPRHRGYATGIPYLENPIAGPLVISIQMIDSMIANHLMGVKGVDIVNNHDGFSHSFMDSDIIGENANQRFYDIMKDYDLAQEIADATDQSIADSADILTGDVSPETLIYGKSTKKGEETKREGGLVDSGLLNFELVSVAYSDFDTEQASKEANAISKTGLLYGEAVRSVIDRKLKEEHYLPDGVPDTDAMQLFVDRVVENITDNTEGTAVGITRVKGIFMDGVTEVAQYSNNGKGVVITNPSTNAKMFGVPVDQVLVTDRQNTNDAAGVLSDLVSDEAYSSSDDTVSIQVSDYPDPVKINAKNVTEVFEDIVDADKQAAHSSIQDSVGHVLHLKGILDGIVSRVMTPIEMFMNQHNLDERETMGLLTPDSDRMWIQTQKISTHPQPGMLGQGIRMSAAEVYVHELVHHITHGGLKKSKHLRTQAQNLYRLAEKSFVDKYGDDAYRVFMNNPFADLNDSANAAEINAARSRWDHVFNPKKNPNGTNNGVDEFISFGLSNDNFKKELADLTIDDATIKARKVLTDVIGRNANGRISLQATIVNLFSRAMDILHQTFYKQQHATRMDQELENLVLAISQVEGRGKNALYAAAIHLDNRAADMRVELDEKVKDLAVKTMNKTQIGRVINKLKKLPELDNMISHKMRLTLNWYNDKEGGLISSIVTEMNGTTDRLKPLHQLLGRRNRVIDAAANEAAATMRSVVNDYFKEELTTVDKVALTKAGLKTDLSSLIGRTTKRAMVGYLSDSKQREARIRALVQEIQSDPALAPYSDFLINAADDLGYYMVTSNIGPDGVPMHNAHNIVKMDGTSNRDALEGNANAVDLVDQLATLSSLRYANKSAKRTLANLMNSDWNGVESVFNHHNLLKEQALKDSFNGSPNLMQKGYTKQILNSRIQYEQGTIADRQRFEDMGFVMQSTPIKRDPRDPVQEDIYMFKSMLGSVNDMQSGIASTTRNSAKGTAAYDIQRQVGNKQNTTAQANLNNARMLLVTRRKLHRMSQPRTGIPNRQTAASHMVPQFDLNGDITKMRYVMSEQTKDTVLQQHSEVDAVLGAMSSQIVNKKYTPEINSDLVVALRDMYDHKDFGFKAMPEAYVEISPYSDVQRYRDIYNMFPPKTKTHIDSMFPGSRLMVPRDVVDLAFGQRKYSVIELLGKTPKDRNMTEAIVNEVLTFALSFRNPFSKGDEQLSKKGRVITRAKRIEDTMTQLTKLAKSNIIVRNLAVTRGNYMSNMMYLTSKGIPLNEISSKSREAIESALQYQLDKARLDVLVGQRAVFARKTSLSPNNKKSLLRKTDKEIARLENELALNPSTALIEAGLMPSVVDDVDTGHLQSPHTFGVDAALEAGLNKLPKNIQGTARTLFMTEDTEGYKMMNNAVKMTDYVGRYVLYHSYVAKGMSHSDAVSSVTDEFINFDLPTHKTLEYLNNIGLVWFSKYQLRVLKHIKNLVKDHPFSTLSTFMLGAFIGNNNILNSVPGITKDTLQAFGDPFTSLFGSGGDILYLDLADTPLQML